MNLPKLPSKHCQVMVINCKRYLKTISYYPKEFNSWIMDNEFKIFGNLSLYLLMSDDMTLCGP